MLDQSWRCFKSILHEICSEDVDGSLSQNVMERAAPSDGRTKSAAGVTILVFAFWESYQVGLLIG